MPETIARNDDMQRQKEAFGELATPTQGLSSEGTLSEYVKNTDYIIGLLDGSIPITGSSLTVDKDKLLEDGKVVFEKSEIVPESLTPPHKVVWLDKSARPVYWMVRELWDQLGTTDYGVAKRPRSQFLNIDRIPWLHRSGIKTSEIDADRSDQFDINNIGSDEYSVKRHLGIIRGLFVDTSRTDESGKKIELTLENFDDEVWNMPLRDLKKGDIGELKPHILVVDEVKSSGSTARIAQELLAAALPEATVTTAHWQNDKSAKTTAHSKGWVPVWYSDKVLDGRGVGNVSAAYYRDSNVNFIQKQAHTVLSTPFVNPFTRERQVDIKAHNLRNDIKLLAKKLVSSEVLYRPSPARINKIERIEHVTGLSFDEWRKKMIATTRDSR